MRRVLAVQALASSCSIREDPFPILDLETITNSGLRIIHTHDGSAGEKIQ